MSSPTIEEELAVFCRGAVDVIDRRQLGERIKEAREQGRPLRVKLGADPSAPDLHLGHGVVLWKLRQIQDLGHQIIFLIGDFTGMIGDPTGRSETRPALTRDQIEANARTYEQQIYKVLDREKTRIAFNSTWLREFDFEKALRLAGKYTVARLLERDDFARRYREGHAIGVHELFYPLMQGYDSVALEADLELGGTDQLFNLLVGRDLQRAHDQPPQIVMTMPLLEGIDGVQKMSKSLGNYVAFEDAPEEMYGKLMSISDELMWRYYLLLTDLTQTRIDEMKADVGQGNLHPMEAKKDLAARMVRLYHGAEAVTAAEEAFSRVHQRGETPADMPLIKPGKKWVIAAVADAWGMSRGEARRLVKQGGFKIDGERFTDLDATVDLRPGMTLQAGKRRFVQVAERSAGSGKEEVRGER